MVLARVRDLVSPSMFVGMVIEGPGPVCLPLLDLVKWMSLHLTWSVFRPLLCSQACTVLKAALMIWVASSLVWAAAEIDLSLTYRVCGNRAEWLVWRLSLMFSCTVSLDWVPTMMALLRGIVK